MSGAAGDDGAQAARGAVDAPAAQNVAAMLALGRRAMAAAYAPYSNFPVGAVVRAEDGGLHAGCNVENAAFPLTACAESAALGALVLAGRRRIVEALVIAPGEALVTPCGGCRQRLREFGGDDLPVHLCGPQGLRRTVTLGELLALSFGPHNLACASGPR